MSETTSSATPLPKKRKLRKGTKSCWQCKRRKIRCSFASPHSVSCDGCTSRQLECVSQHYDESQQNVNCSTSESLQSEVEFQSACSRPKSAFVSRGHDLSVTLSPSLSLTTNEDLGEVSQFLIQAWPNSEDLNLLLSIPVNPFLLLHGATCKPYHKCATTLMKVQNMFKLPLCRNVHPVLVARNLLVFAIYLKAATSGDAEKLTALSTSCHILASRFLSLVSRLVTTNDEMVLSLEGVECIMLESMFWNNAGNLRKAWIVNRRAILTAQMMGLHAGKISTIPILEPETRHRVEPSYMWFRLVTTDRYLSLMLGLPQASHEEPFAHLEQPVETAPLGNMEQQMTQVAGFIIQRNNSRKFEISSTLENDQLLQEAAALTSPALWSIGNLHRTVIAKKGPSFEETIQIMIKFAFYHLLIQLHLPFMLQLSADTTENDYSKLTAANASRSALTMFVLFHKSNSVSTYCRGVDFIALVASTALCLAHMQPRGLERVSRGNLSSAIQSLKHQRLGDRGLLEEVLKIMTEKAQSNEDAIAARISGILQPILEVGFEATSSQSRACTLDESHSHEDFGASVDQAGGLHIQIPHLGTIKIAQEDNDSRQDGWKESQCIGTTTTQFYSDVSIAAEDSATYDMNNAAFQSVDISGLDGNDHGWIPNSVEMALSNLFTGESAIDLELV
ncbi:uncharacterized protein PV09_04551 [Verruconis gallopava]|uniref:Zn(2)-C6 fungal-type domain-containing protein n=1 Tax=Verruconis gallopava TaxID=253628 RepID=A0A0D1XNU5_9PEZI|nr:uncharacterized protein PV09_04551 [Verruconis gallopava]KIW04246.1 hypothetical protein PV09_04551 [Verruconis gallopava]